MDEMKTLTVGGTTYEVVDETARNAAEAAQQAAENVSVPTKVSELDNDAGYISSVPVTSVNGKTGAVELSASDVGAAAESHTHNYAASSHSHGAATTSTAGFMSASDKSKLDGIASGATANTGTITGVTAGNGLTGGGTSGAVTLNIGAGTGISVAADTVGLASGVCTAGTYGPSANVSGTNGATISVPQITVDTYGRVTGVTNRTYTSVNTDTNTDTKVTNTLATTTKAYVTGTTSSSTNTGTQVFDTGVYLDTTAGMLTATTFKGALSGNATSATKATQDGNGSTISSTYAKLSASNTFHGEQKMVHDTYAPTMNDIASGVGCSLKNSRACDNQLIAAEIFAPYTAATDSTLNMTSTAGEIPFYSISSVSSGAITGKTLLGKINSNGWVGNVTGTVTGNASSATKLATARTFRTNLGSTSTASFNGTANVTPGVTGTLPVANGGTGATTAAAARTNLGITLANLGAAAASHTHDYLPLSGGTMTGNIDINNSAPALKLTAPFYGTGTVAWGVYGTQDGMLLGFNNASAACITLYGQMYAAQYNDKSQAPSASLLRNSKLVSAETNPTVNGEICWTYE